MAKNKPAQAERRKPPPAAVKNSDNSDSETVDGLQIPVQLQQQILDAFRDAFFQSEDDSLEHTIQKIKQHLYDRDFAAAFGTEQNLLAYAARWSPSRALGYLQIFHGISKYVIEGDRPEQPRPQFQDVPSGPGSVAQLESTSSAMSALVISERYPQNSTINEQTSTRRNADDPPPYGADVPVPAYEHPPAYGVNTGLDSTDDGEFKPSMRITCLGGGAGAELIASAAWLRLQSEISSETLGPDFGRAMVESNSLEVNCLDIAEWYSVVDRLDDAIKTAPVISKYASEAAKAANVAMLPSDAMRSLFYRQDLLEAHPDNIRTLFQSSDLVTIMFTLNELYSASVSKTQRLLFELTVATKPGTLLLVVDSPGSYSTVRLNNTEKRYPMHWLLDHTLLEASRNTRILPRATHWQKLLTDESRWFRLPKDLNYPIELENMRYQIHLYRRLGMSDDPAAPGPSVSLPQR